MHLPATLGLISMMVTLPVKSALLGLAMTHDTLCIGSNGSRTCHGQKSLYCNCLVCCPTSQSSAASHSSPYATACKGILIDSLQDAIWEAEFQAHEWRQHLLRQRMARRSSLQRCAPSRSMSMPSSRQQCTTYMTRDTSDLPVTTALACSHISAAAHADSYDSLPTVSEHCSAEHLTDTHLPLIRVPSSLSEVNTPLTASGAALVSSRSSAAGTSGSGGGPYVTPYMPPFGSSSKAGRQRRTSDASQTATPSLQTVLSLAAKVRSPLHASAMYQDGQARGRGRAQSSASAAARVKADQGVGSTCRSSSGKAKTIGDQGLLSQSSPSKVSSTPQRYRSCSVRGQAWWICPCTAKLVSDSTTSACWHHLLHR